MTSTLDRPELSTPPGTVTPVATPPPPRGRAARFVRGTDGDPRWARPALLVLLSLTAVLYLWDLSASGNANSFYAAAVQSGTKSWKAWFFGSLDSGNSITVDKPPASLWIMGLSARIFGFNSWSLLAPQALEGVASVGLLYGSVRRVVGLRGSSSGHVAGLIAGAVLALTPAAVLMFRFDNPDALLVLLMTAAAYATTRALEKASARWMMLAGSALGFAFLTKMLQGLLVLPALALAYLLFAPTTLRRRIGHTLLGGLALMVSAGWYVLVVALWPAGSRPYIGGSGDNTILGLVFGYNGFGRIFGGTGNASSTGTSGSSFGGSTGLTRLFSSEMGNEISWLLPAALVALVAGLVATRRAARTDRTRAALVVWGGWLIVTGLVFSYMKGTIHPYYTVALAPAVAALVAIGSVLLWQARTTLLGRIGLATMIVTAGGWSFVLLDRVSSWYPSLRWAVALLSVLAVAGVLVPLERLGRIGRAGRGVVVAGIAAGLIGTAAFGVATAAEPHSGSIPDVGPSVAASSRSSTGGPRGTSMGQSAGTRPSGTRPSGARPTGSQGSGSSSSTKSMPGASSTSTSASGASSSGMTVGGGSSSSTKLTAALKATSTTWAAAVSGDQTAADLELVSGKAVIAIGGWSGSDDSPTLAQFKAYVAEGKITYYIASGTQSAGGSNSGSAAQIQSWVAKHFAKTTIGGSTVYKLT